MPDSALPRSEHILVEENDGSVRSFDGGRYRAALISVRDPQKEHNEDGAVAVDLGAEGVVLAVVDGMGGMKSGRAAARAAVEAIAASLRARVAGQTLRGAVVCSLEQAHLAVLEAAPGGGATVAAAIVSDDSLQTVHAGDAEVLVFGQRGRIKSKTMPHSPVGYAVGAGILHEDDALEHPDRHLVSNGLGLEGMTIEVGPRVPLGRFDTVVLATDGLTDNAFVHEVVEHLRCGALEERTTELVALCRKRMAAALAGEVFPIDPGRGPGVDNAAPGKPDDLTLIVLRRSN